MFVLGGRSNQVGESLPFEIYDTESSDWYKFQAVQRFRHTIWTIDKYLYCHGGFDQDTPNIPTQTTVRVDLLELFRNHANLLGNIQRYIENQRKPDSNTNGGLDGTFSRGGMEIEDQTNNQVRQVIDKIYPNGETTKDKDKSANRNVRISPLVVVANIFQNDDDINKMIKKINVDSLQEERKKIGVNTYVDNYEMNKIMQLEQLYNPIITNLLIPKTIQ